MPATYFGHNMIPSPFPANAALTAAARRFTPIRIAGTLSFSTESGDGTEKKPGGAERGPAPDPPVFGRGVRLVPHSGSVKVWQAIVDGASKSIRAQMRERNPSVVFLASSSPSSSFLFGGNEDTSKADEARERVVQLLQGKGYEVRDLGSGAQATKVKELAQAIQSIGTSGSAGDTAQPSPPSRGIFLTGRSSMERSPLTSTSSQAAALIANKHRGIHATVCHDVHSAKASRSLLATNVLVMTGDETRLQEMVDGWIGQEVDAPPRSPVGEIPEWWPDDDDVIKEVVTEHRSIANEVENAVQRNE